MVVIIPVPLIVPATFMLVPPSMAVFPAPYPCLMELVSPVVCLPAVVAVLFNRAVQFVVCVNQPPLAIIICIGSWRSSQEHPTCEHHCPAEELDQARFPSTCIHGSLPPQVSLEAGLPLRHTGFFVRAWSYVTLLNTRWYQKFWGLRTAAILPALL